MDSSYLKTSDILNTSSFIRREVIEKRIKNLNDKIDKVLQDEQYQSRNLNLSEYIGSREHELSTHIPKEKDTSYIGKQNITLTSLYKESIPRKNKTTSITELENQNIQLPVQPAISDLNVSSHIIQDLDAKRKELFLSREKTRLIKHKQFNILPEDLHISVNNSLIHPVSNNKDIYKEIQYVKKKEYSKVLSQNFSKIDSVKMDVIANVDKPAISRVHPEKAKSLPKIKNGSIHKSYLQEPNRRVIKEEINMRSKSPMVNILRTPLKNVESNNREKSVNVSRSPMLKKPDYLTEARLVRQASPEKKHKSIPIKWNKILESEGNLQRNIQQIKMIANDLEVKAKRKEQLLKLRGSEDSELSTEISSLLIDSIQAKLAILDKIRSPNNKIK